MPKKEISWILKARDSVTGVLRKVSRRFKSFAGGTVKIARNMALGMAAVGGAIAAVGVSLLKAFAEQQKAEQSVSSAIAALGKNRKEVKALTKQYKNLASAIQKETGAADESTLANMALMTQLGVMTDQMGDAARAVVALQSVQLKARQASRYVALAIAGEYEALQRYIPALQTATSEAEKSRIVNDSLNRMYREQQDRLSTLEGGWKRFTGVIGDLKELMGEALNEGGKFGRWLYETAVRLEQFGKSKQFQDFLDKLERGTRLIKRTISAMAAGGEEGRAVWVATANFLKVSLIEGGKSIASKLLEVAPKIGALIKEGAKGLVPETYWTKKARGEKAVQRIDPREMDRLTRLDAMRGGDSDLLEKRIQDEIRKIKFEELMLKVGVDTSELDPEKGRIGAAMQALEAALTKAEAGQDKPEIKPPDAPEPIDITPKAPAETEYKKVTKDLDFRLRIQQKLNQGLETEAELMRIQRRLGRDLTDQEKARLRTRLENLKAAEGESAIERSQRELPGGAGEFESIRRIGGGFAGREKSQIREQTRLAKKQLDKLGTIAKSTEEMARNQLDLEMR